MSSGVNVLEDLTANFRQELARFLVPEDVARVEAALEFSRAAHDGQFRRSGEPYVTHCIHVAMILMDLLRRRTDPVILQAALLHDVLEDNLNITYQDMANRFGEEVTQLVSVQAGTGGPRLQVPRTGALPPDRRSGLDQAGGA
ncbi:MAG: bifunctional (p)ppGpp synthetase/guanosine-3',5'-bis(diphosphate) 3'-pyrophosphohydrolase [Candidatus Eisenbacteria bacterium]|nr:bifunctional (p)ppGpp synthetase/guanosine-3',5'-bis(diphosphate) 3'-pyrophosphohydrolase [Candidatus Eisenbacteria bacterium]